MPFSLLAPALGTALTERGYTAFTAVQQAVLEPEALGRDLLVSAQTGSGKTVAFGVAMAADLLGEATHFERASDPLALVIAPTRELALQVERELAWLYAKVGGRVMSCVGGMDARREARALAGGVHIVVGTPGRLRDHLERGNLAIGALKVVVLDEADEMLDMGFREELEEILDATPAERRTLMFSATMPKSIAVMAKVYQRDALRISTVNSARGHGDISYQAITVAPADIEHAVVNILRYHDPAGAIVFCATRESVRRLHASLQERGFEAVALSGEHSQNERNQALQALRDRRAKVCVATDVAARGIDLPDLRLVIHAELPRDGETLQHRSGRTGRAGKKGTAVLVVPFPRRRRVESMLRDAKITAEWGVAPTPDAIRARDGERLLEQLLEPREFDEMDRALATRLMAQHSAEDIAAILIHTQRTKLPPPEELIEGGTSTARGTTEIRPDNRAGFEDSRWFSLNIGRRQQADPRWILPLLCRRGHITKSEVGAIRITDSETLFQIPAAAAQRFMAAVLRTASDDPEADDGLRIEARQEAPARGPRPSGGRSNDERPRSTGARPSYGAAKPAYAGAAAKPAYAGSAEGPRFGKGPRPKPAGGAPEGGEKSYAKPSYAKPGYGKAATGKPSYGGKPAAGKAAYDAPANAAKPPRRPKP